MKRKRGFAPTRSRESWLEEARSLEAEAERSPEDRAELLSDAAAARAEAGEHGRAVELRHDVLELNPEFPVMERCFLADSLYEIGEYDEADELLEQVRRDPAASSLDFQLVAEMFEHHERLAEAERWATRGLLAALPDPTQPTATDIAQIDVRSVAMTRQRLRAAQGKSTDDYDRLTLEVHHKHAEELPSEAGDEPDTGLAAAALVEEYREIRSKYPTLDHDSVELYWPADEFDELLRHWPELARDDDHFRGFGDTYDEHRRSIERRHRQHREAGRSRLIVARATEAELREFAQQRDAPAIPGKTLNDYANSVVVSGNFVAWPPERNAPCWCGAGLKYKKCCGRPGM